MTPRTITGKPVTFVGRAAGHGRRGTAVIAAAATALLLASCGGDDGGDGGGEKTSVSLMLPFQESTSFYGTLLADEMGYFEDEDLDVTIEPSGGGSVALQQVISGNQDLGLVSPGLVMTATAEGSELVVPYSDKHRNLFSVVVPADSDIASMEDLEGGVIGITDFGGGELPLTRAAMDQAGLEEGANVELLVVGEGGPAVISAFDAGEIDAYAASWSDFFPLTVSGMDVKEVIQPELASLPSEVLVATAEFAEENGDVIEAVSRALAKGSYFATYSPDATINVLTGRIPEEMEDEDVARRALELWLDIAAYPEVDGELRFGQHDPDAWERLKEVLAAEADVEDVDVDSILDDSHLDAVNDWDRADVEADADEQS